MGCGGVQRSEVVVVVDPQFAAEAAVAKAPDAATGASNRTVSKGFRNKVLPTDEPRLKTARFFILRAPFALKSAANRHSPHIQ